jgi:hypothetical protein
MKKLMIALMLWRMCLFISVTTVDLRFWALRHVAILRNSYHLVLGVDLAD